MSDSAVARPTWDRWRAALGEGAVLAARCPRCGRVWLPPRPVCPADHAIPEWVRLSGEGTIEFAIAAVGAAGEPGVVYVLARMDGADTALCGRLYAAGAPSIEPGTRVRVVPHIEPDMDEGCDDGCPAGAAWRFTLIDD